MRISTTRADTIFGVGFIALAPEHPMIRQIVAADKRAAVEKFVQDTSQIPETERASKRDKNGVYLGVDAIHPLTKERIPMYVADYVLGDYATGAVMGVPAHDQRDMEFAMKHNLPIKQVIIPAEQSHATDSHMAFEGEGILQNSGPFSGLSSADGRARITHEVSTTNVGGTETHFKIRDWLISRQRYWGAPIPIIYCGTCNVVPVPEEQLPVLLPSNVKITGKGSPLADHKDWVNTTCPKYCIH